jgi:hypothetical protein
MGLVHHGRNALFFMSLYMRRQLRSDVKNVTSKALNDPRWKSRDERKTV